MERKTPEERATEKAIKYFSGPGFRATEEQVKDTFAYSRFLLREYWSDVFNGLCEDLRIPQLGALLIRFIEWLARMLQRKGVKVYWNCLLKRNKNFLK